MRLLCTNDDGILAQGLACMIEAAEPLGEITVVAPDREQSATSHSLTLHHPIRPIERGERRFQVDGTPTDCVMLAVEALMPERPDFVLSGINHGQNMGEDVLYSGTVAAAMEGLSLGIPSVAISFAGGDLRTDVSMLRDQIEPLRNLLKHVFSLRPFPEHTLLNINMPPLRGDDIMGVRLTRLGRRVYSDSLTPMQDPWGRQIYWIGGGSIAWSGEETSDFRAIQEGYISVTPLHLDLTHHAMLASAERWWQLPLEHEFRGPRRRLVELLHEQGIKDLAVLNAIDKTPRHLFVPTGVRHRAYEDSALPIGNGQTISQPSIHARYLELLKLKGNEKVLEIGTGSGYQTALLSQLAGQVFSIERIPALLDKARETIQQIGARNISFLMGDGTLGWRQYAPYDAILVGAGAPEVPSTYHEQLTEGGRILIPLGDREEQTLYMFTRRGDKLDQTEIAPVRFVPLVGKYSWEGL